MHSGLGNKAYQYQENEQTIKNEKKMTEQNWQIWEVTIQNTIANIYLTNKNFRTASHKQWFEFFCMCLINVNRPPIKILNHVNAQRLQ